MSFFRYPGGKSKLHHIILKHLNNTKNSTIEYREPFFGGGSIGLKFIASNNIQNIWINDKDIGIASLWTSVLYFTDELKNLILHFQPSVKQFYEFKEELLHLQAMPTEHVQIVDIGFKKLAIHQISYSGLGTKSGGPLGGAKQESIYKIDCRWSPTYICKKINKIQAQLKPLNIKCTNLDFTDLINDNSCASLLYLDPPYFIKGQELYQWGFSLEDHERLANVLSKTNHNWVLSYDDCPEIRSLYHWARIITLDILYTINSVRTKSELLILSPGIT